MDGAGDMHHIMSSVDGEIRECETERMQGKKKVTLHTVCRKENMLHAARCCLSYVVDREWAVSRLECARKKHR